MKDRLPVPDILEEDEDSDETFNDANEQFKTLIVFTIRLTILA